MRLFGRMQRIRQQQEAIAAFGLVRSEDARLASAIRMAAEKNFARIGRWHELSGGSRAYRNDSRLQTSLIVRRGFGQRRPEGAALAKGQITPQHRITRITERAGHGDQERCAAVVSGAMCENKFVSVAFSGLMQETPNNARFKRRNACRVHFRRLWPIRGETGLGCRDILPR